MKEKIIIFIIGALVGAIISTLVFYLVYNNSGNPGMGEPPEFSNNQRLEPPQMPNDNNESK